MSSVVLIFLFIRDELSYDNFHESTVDIYRIAWQSGDPQTRTPHPMPLGMLRNFPEVEMGTLHQPIRPIIFQILPPTYNNLLLKVKTDDFENLISQVENVWKNFDNSFGFEFTFLDQTIDEQYWAEQRMGKVFSGFSFLAIIIAAMGLFALASLMFANKAKEIGIRKVLGAQPVHLLLCYLRTSLYWLLLVL